MPTPSSAILHVENDADDIFLTQRAFKKVGVTNPTPAVENGEQAVSYLLGKGKFENRKDYPLPSVILLDWNMPLMSGSDFLHWLRAQTGALRRLPVVVLTSSNSHADVRQAYELGANGYLVKPATQESFQAMARAFAEYWLDWNRSDSIPAGESA
jgi:CheY-like chemotaxis protein